MRAFIPRPRSNGFTLIELIVVVIVLGILMAIAVPSFLGAQNGARDTAAKATLTMGFKAAKMGAAANANRFDVGAALISSIGSSEPELRFSSGTPTEAARCDTAEKAVMVDSGSSATDITLYTRSGNKTWKLTASDTTSPQFSESPCGEPSGVGISSPVVSLVGGSSLFNGVTATATATTNGTLSYQWVRETVGVQDGHPQSFFAPIGGATSASYIVSSADPQGSLLAVQITATSPGGMAGPLTVSVGSIGVAPASPPSGPPSNTSPPTIRGFAVVGDSLNGDPGSWTGSTRSNYSWERSSTDGGPYTTIANSNNPSHLLVTGDLAFFFRFCVTASNDGPDSTTVCSSQTTTAVTAGALPAAPANIVLPTIMGSAVNGTTLTTTMGVWSGQATGGAFSWERGGSGSYTPIAGANGPTHALGVADIGQSVRYCVTLIGPGGQGTACSSPLGPVTA